MTSTSAVTSKKSPSTNDWDYEGFHENYNLPKKQTNQFTFSFFIVSTQNTGNPLTNTVITKKLPINRDFG